VLLLLFSDEFVFDVSVEFIDPDMLPDIEPEALVLFWSELDE